MDDSKTVFLFTQGFHSYFDKCIKYIQVFYSFYTHSLRLVGQSSILQFSLDQEVTWMDETRNTWYYPCLHRMQLAPGVKGAGRKLYSNNMLTNQVIHRTSQDHVRLEAALKWEFDQIISMHLKKIFSWSLQVLNCITEHQRQHCF